jgi:hypothetical protein
MIDSQTILNAQKYHLNSFETGIQVECVDKYQLDAIITLRYRDFLECGFINFFSPQEFVESYDAKKQNGLEINSTETKLNRTVAISFLKNQAEENEKILLFDGWEIEHFDLTCSGGSMSSATVVIVNNQSKYRQCRYSESAFGVGATATLFSAFDKVIRHIVDDSNYILDSIKVSKMEKGVDGSVIADLVVKYDNQNIRKYYGHKNVIKACFHAYVEAINVIYNPDTEDSTCDQTASLSPVTKVSLEEVIEKYNSGIRPVSYTHLTLPTNGW